MKRILLIDDDVQVRKILARILERAGYEVLNAENGDEGIRLYREEPTDLIITDIIMPGKEGLETIRELRRDYPEVKIIAISGGGQLGGEGYLYAAEGFGVDRSFIKPIKRKELLEAVQDLLDAPATPESENN